MPIQKRTADPSPWASRRTLAQALLFVVAIGAAAFCTGSARQLPFELLLDLARDAPIGWSPFEIAHLDPTGKRVAWLSRGDRLVVFELATGDVQAIALPAKRHPITDFVWSPDGRHVAMADNVFLYLYEPDIWLVDAGTGATYACTNDLAFGGVLDVRDGAWLDFHPAWRSPGVLTFLRVIGDELQGPVELRAISPDRCGPISRPSDPDATSDLWRLPDRFPTLFHVLAPPVWSPDDPCVAIITQGPAFRDVTDGVWILEGATGATVQFIPTQSFAAGFPSWYDTTSIVPQELAWMDGGSRLVVFAEDVSPTATWPRRNAFLVDPTTGAVEPLVDYTRFPDLQSFLQPGENGHTGVFDVPIQAAVSSDDATLLTVHQDLEQSTVELRLHHLVAENVIVRAFGAFEATPYARVRGPNLVPASDRDTVLLLNRYLVRIDEPLGEAAGG